MAGVLLGMGNPLLDISAKCDAETLTKYGLKGGDAILAEEQHFPLYDELMANPEVEYIAGGATQNTIRVAQWMMQTAGASSYMGCVGQDANATTLEECCKKDGVNAVYRKDAEAPTGTCGCVIVGHERSLVTKLEAANKYSAEHLKENMAIVEKAQVCYSAGFFVTVSPESIDIVSSHCNEKNKTYCFNLSAPFIVQVPPFRAQLEKLLPATDYLFGNETEAQAYAEAVGWETTDVEFIATRLSLVPSTGGKPPRKVVITQGCDPTIVAIRGVVKKYPVIALPKEKLVDTNGAGDAFVGGFLAALVKGKDMEGCCKAGAYSASVIIQHSGCTYPAKPEYSF
jgi:adenosine kinase